MFDLSSIPTKQLREMRENLPVVLAQRKAQKSAELQAEICRLIEHSGLTRAEVLGPLLAVRPVTRAQGSATVTGRVVTVPSGRYRNPRDNSQEWLGRGKRPRWLAELLEDGFTLEQLRVAA